jgi:hypothetical protein
VPPSVPALRDHYRNGAAPTLLMALIALSTPLPSTAEMAGYLSLLPNDRQPIFGTSYATARS